MGRRKRISTLLSVIQRYYIQSADLFFLVQNIQFRVHRFFFERGGSALYRAKLSAPASPGSSKRDFEKFLWVFYNPRFSLYPRTRVHLDLHPRSRTQMGLLEVKDFCVRELEQKTIEELGDIDRIVVYHAKRGRPEPLIPVYAALCLKLGMETTVGDRQRPRVLADMGESAEAVKEEELQQKQQPEGKSKLKVKTKKDKDESSGAEHTPTVTASATVAAAAKSIAKGDTFGVNGSAGGSAHEELKAEAQEVKQPEPQQKVSKEKPRAPTQPTPAPTVPLVSTTPLSTETQAKEQQQQTMETPMEQQTTRDPSLLLPTSRSTQKTDLTPQPLEEEQEDEQSPTDDISGTNHEEVTKPDDLTSTDEIIQEQQSTIQDDKETDPKASPAPAQDDLVPADTKDGEPDPPPRQPRRIPSLRSHLSTRPLSKSPKLQLLLLSKLLLLLRLLVPVPPSKSSKKKKKTAKKAAADAVQAEAEPTSAKPPVVQDTPKSLKAEVSTPIPEPAKAESAPPPKAPETAGPLTGASESPSTPKTVRLSKKERKALAEAAKKAAAEKAERGAAEAATPVAGVDEPAKEAKPDAAQAPQAGAGSGRDPGEQGLSDDPARPTAPVTTSTEPPAEAPQPTDLVDVGVEPEKASSSSPPESQTVSVSNDSKTDIAEARDAAGAKAPDAEGTEDLDWGDVDESDPWASPKPESEVLASETKLQPDFDVPPKDQDQDPFHNLPPKPSDDDLELTPLSRRTSTHDSPARQRNAPSIWDSMDVPIANAEGHRARVNSNSSSKSRPPSWPAPPHSPTAAPFSPNSARSPSHSGTSSAAAGGKPSLAERMAQSVKTTNVAQKVQQLNKKSEEPLVEGASKLFKGWFS
ncbi:hypothetical protein BKA70DRAFT_1424788 [Coprinopsis sp. MPI-PUGE-AT-0042]|nr:hypothetical protein BKA70DRAFT_1424788 [Coprinopsis sp. MPI-PUGE-AT-0042]